MRDICAYGVCFPKQLLCMLRLYILGSSWTSACWWEVANKYPLFPLFPCMAFAFLTKLPLSQPMGFLILFSPPVLLRRGSERETESGVWQPAKANPPQNQKLYKETAVDIVYLDFSKAFDTVFHKVLIEKLLMYQLPEQTMR